MPDQPITEEIATMPEIEQTVKNIEEIKTIEARYAKQPDKFMLTLKARRFGVFGVNNAQITLLQNEKVVETITTDKQGNAILNLTPGDYVVRFGEKKIPITLKQHSTLKL